MTVDKSWDVSVADSRVRRTIASPPRQWRCREWMPVIAILIRETNTFHDEIGPNLFHYFKAQDEKYGEGA